MIPAYHLRLNKAVDRFFMIDLLRCFSQKELANYRYVGLGGPFLEDFKLMGNFFPSLRTISFELKNYVFLRQKFNKPTKLVALQHGDIVTGVRKLAGKRDPLIVWFDSTQGTKEVFDGFISILESVPDRSIVRVTMRLGRRDVNPNGQLIESLTDALTGLIQGTNLKAAQSKALVAGVSRIVDEQVSAHTSQRGDLLEISRFLPSNYKQMLGQKNGLIDVYFTAIQNAALEAIPIGSGRGFCLLNASYYSDGTKMLSVTGAVVSEEDREEFWQRFKGTKFEHVQWTDRPQQIDMPVLTPKERLHLNAIMPVNGDPGRRLVKRLGFKIDESDDTTRSEMEMYNKFYQYYPIFAKVAL